MFKISSPLDDVASPAGLKRALQASRNIKSVRREYWWPGHVHYQAGINSGVIGQAFNVTNATNVNPVKVTTDKAHGLTTGDAVTIKGVTGNTNANVTGVTVHVVDSTSFTLDATAGNAAYGEGGTVLTPKTNGESADIFSLTGTGVVTEINLILGSSLTQNDCQLWVYVDGDVAGSPSLMLPMCDLLGLGNGVAWNTTGVAFDQAAKKRGNAFWTTDNIQVEWEAYDPWSQAAGPTARLSIKFPIPFTTACRATLFQCGASDNTSTNTFAVVNYTMDVQSPLRLKCARNPALLTDGTTPYTQSATAGGADFTMLNIASGYGFVVGTSISFDSWNNDDTGSTVLERNIYLYRDQEATASYQSSGTEDYFGSSFYFRSLVSFQFSGVNLYFWRPSGTGNSQFSADIALCSVFKDNLQCDKAGLGFSNGVTMKWMYAPDGATRVTSNANARSMVLYYQ